MVDIHCHILPGIDDGATDSVVSGKMLEAAAEDGVDTIFCTPHFSKQVLRESGRLREELSPRAAALGIRLLPGAEYSYTHFHWIPDELLPLGDSGFLLIDLDCPTLPPSLRELFFALERRGYQIIVAHPERYLADPGCCDELARLGVFFQLNADSILGLNGSGCRRMAERLIRAGHCHYIASDAHGTHRTFRLSECRRRLEAERGSDFVRLVMDRNPQRLLENRLPETPEPRRGWLSCLLRREG